MWVVCLRFSGGRNGKVCRQPSTRYPFHTLLDSTHSLHLMVDGNNQDPGHQNSLLYTPNSMQTRNVVRFSGAKAWSIFAAHPTRTPLQNEATSRLDQG